MTLLGMPLTSAPRELHSSIDSSVNFVSPIMGDMEALEARYVRRAKEYIVAYLSPQTACAQACRFCHLTASGQVKGRDATVDEIGGQAVQVLSYYASAVEAGLEDPARIVHYNFMARGEALASRVMLEQGDQVMERLFGLAKKLKLTPAVKISTIGTDKVDRLLDVFPYEQPDFYYSVYSLNPAFRKRWLPNAPEVLPFLELLKDWQRITRKIPTLHHALIQGENDGLLDAEGIIEAVNQVGLVANVNIVRYNPPSARHGVESLEETLESHRDLYLSAWPASQVTIVKKVGFDVAASCGMFVGGRQPK